MYFRPFSSSLFHLLCVIQLFSVGVADADDVGFVKNLAKPVGPNYQDETRLARTRYLNEKNGKKRAERMEKRIKGWHYGSYDGSGEQEFKKTKVGDDKSFLFLNYFTLLISLQGSFETLIAQLIDPRIYEGFKQE
ncbi:hypothetical protein [Phaffia rhodozyma]|uniref:Uncharacterized protein n=1 Tax=Phaffia rhodozyma TaxID=264483 RepID=A0A0F7SUL6_PHARH|nr:hypothetical protein [Phaffia rhodozyma]